MGCSNSTMHGAATPRASPILQREKTGFVAFEIDIKNNQSKELNKDIDKILSRPLPPKRLQALEPLERGAKLTAEDLEKKMVLAEEKRQRTMEKRIEFSRRSSIRRQSISQDPKTDTTSQDRMNAAEELRTQRLLQIQNREKLRNEKVARIRDEAIRKREGLDELESEFREVECRESSDEESWRGSGNKMKKLPPIGKSKLDNTYDSSGYSSRNVSATQESKSEPMATESHQEQGSLALPITKPKTTYFDDVDNFYSENMSQESESEQIDDNRRRAQDNRNKVPTVTPLELF